MVGIENNTGRRFVSCTALSIRGIHYVVNNPEPVKRGQIRFVSKNLSVELVGIEK